MQKLIIILGVVGTGFSAILARFADVPSTVLAFYRMFISILLLMVPTFYFHKCEWKEITRKDMFLCAISGAFLGAHFVCYFQSLNYTSIASAVVLIDTEVFFVALGGIIFLQEWLTKLGLVSIGVTFVGNIIIAFGDFGNSNVLGDCIALLGAICSSVYTLLGRKLRSRISTTVYTWIVYFFASVVTFAASWMTGAYVLTIDRKNLLIAFGMAVFCTLLGHSIFSWGLKYEKASFISTVKLMEPIVASMLGIILLKEIPKSTSVIGGVVIIMGILLCLRSGKEKS